MNNTSIQRVDGDVVKEGFGEIERRVDRETAATAVAAQAQALVQARYIVALQRPRDIDTVGTKIQKDCKRPGFAQSAIYRKPVGGDHIEGPSVRFVEAALRHLGNVMTSIRTTFDDERARVINVSVTDLETNAYYDVDVTVDKHIERRDARGREVVSARKNKNGSDVYIVKATDDELLVKQNALVSKARRNLGLALIPGDIVEDAMFTCRQTRKDADARDPDESKKRMLMGFSELNITPADLRDYLGHDVAKVTPAELTELRSIYVALKDGEASWETIIDKKRPEKKGDSKPGQSKLETMKQAMREREPGDDDDLDVARGDS